LLQLLHLKTQYVVYNSVIFQKNNHMLCLPIYIRGDALYNKDDENYFLPLFITFFFFHLEYLTVPWFVTHTTRGQNRLYEMIWAEMIWAEMTDF
jgi:hypothetical protein